MQKVITISIDLQQLTQQTNGVFALSEVESLNDVLAEGWVIEDYTFLSDDAVNGKMPLLVILSDGTIESDLWPYNEDSYLDEFDENDFEEDEFDDDDDKEEKDK